MNIIGFVLKMYFGLESDFAVHFFSLDSVV